MPKVKITKEIKELEGDVVEKVVTPFGTSAHIGFSKKHTGKYVDIVIPKEPSYSWILSKEELKTFTDGAKEIIEDGKLRVHELDRVNRLKKLRFSLADLDYLCILLEEKNKCSVITKKIRKAVDFR